MGRPVSPRRTCWRRARSRSAGATVDLADITVPFLNIIGEKDHIVPPDGVGRCRRSSGPTDVEELRLPAGHVGRHRRPDRPAPQHPGDGRLDRAPRRSRS